MTDNELIDLAKAIYAAGFRHGRDAGFDAVLSSERGEYPRSNQTPKEEWDQNIAPTIEPRCIREPKFWNDL